MREKDLAIQAAIDAMTFPDGSVDQDIVETLYELGLLDGVIDHFGIDVRKGE